MSHNNPKHSKRETTPGGGGGGNQNKMEKVKSLLAKQRRKRSSSVFWQAGTSLSLTSDRPTITTGSSSILTRTTRMEWDVTPPTSVNPNYLVSLLLPRTNDYKMKKKGMRKDEGGWFVLACCLWKENQVDVITYLT